MVVYGTVAITDEYDGRLATASANDVVVPVPPAALLPASLTLLEPSLFGSWDPLATVPRSYSSALHFLLNGASSQRGDEPR